VNITRFPDAQSFLNRAGNWLLLQEAENNLVLGIANRLLSQDHPYGNPIYLATVEADDQITGCAWRTPPHKLGLTRLPINSVPLLVRGVADVYTGLPAVLGPEEEATEFAKLWARQFGSKWAIGMRQRIYRLDRVTPPSALVHGALRRAESADATLAAEWGAAFARDTGIEDLDPLAYSERSIRAGSLYLWDDREPRSMAATVGTTPNGIRVGYVYTPPAFRSRGYATATVASLSQLLLDGGQRFCFLYTDLENPISNAIYERIGYQPATDVVDVNFF
jgi:RimJ/RimL family protein N-acetyltransferase